MDTKLLVTIPFLLTGLLACGGGGSTAASTGTLTLKLGSDSTSGYSQVWVSAEKVEVKESDSSTWSTLATVEQSWDLMALQNGNGATLLSTGSLETGTYDIRITWGSTNYKYTALSAGALLTSGTDTLDAVPMTLPTTTTATGTFTIAKDTLTTAEIFIQGNQVAQYHAGLSVPYTFQATAEVVDLGASATIAGQVTDAGSGGISGAEVFAETVDGSLTPSVSRRALTDASGNFTLEGLPIGTTTTYYYLATQPGTSSTAYAAAASEVAASSATTYTAGLQCTASGTPGGLAATITPTSSTSQATWVELCKYLTAGSDTQKLIVRSQPVSSGTSADTTTFTGLYPGAFGVMVQRNTGGTVTSYTGSSTTVSASGTAATTIAAN